MTNGFITIQGTDGGLNLVYAKHCRFIGYKRITMVKTKHGMSFETNETISEILTKIQESNKK